MKPAVVKRKNSVKERRIRSTVFQTPIIWQLISAWKGHWTKPFLRQSCEIFYNVKRWTKASDIFYKTTHRRQEKTDVGMHPERIYQSIVNERKKHSFPFSCPYWCTCWQLGSLFCWAEVTVQKMTPKLRVLGTCQHTVLFSWLWFCLQSIALIVEVFAAGGLHQGRLLCSKIVPLERGISENQARGIYMILPF